LCAQDTGVGVGAHISGFGHPLGSTAPGHFVSLGPQNTGQPKLGQGSSGPELIVAQTSEMGQPLASTPPCPPSQFQELGPQNTGQPKLGQAEEPESIGAQTLRL
jgi:hypothetical protein